MTTKPRLLWVIGRYWPAIGGVESYVRHLSHEMSRDFEITVLAQRVDQRPGRRLDEVVAVPPPFEPFVDQGVRVIPLALDLRHKLALAPLVTHVTPGLRRYAYGPQRRLMGSLYASVVGSLVATYARRADVVHAWSGNMLAWASVRGARRVGLPTVITPFAHPGQWSTDIASAHAYRAADRVIGLLEADADTYRKLGVAEDRLRVCGICSPGATNGDGEGIRRRHSIEGPLVMFLGARRGYKGHDVLLAAIPRLRAARPDVTVVFVGPGEPLEIPPGEPIIDAGAVAEDVKADWLAAADLLCLPSQGEIFPGSILEAWSARTPTVATDIPPLRELLVDTGGGWVVERDPDLLADRLTEVLNDPAAIAAAAERGFARWQAHGTPAAVAAWHADLYEELTTASNGAPRGGYQPNGIRQR